MALTVLKTGTTPAGRIEGCAPPLAGPAVCEIEIVGVNPNTDRLRFRANGPPFGATVKPIVPLPVPDAPVVIDTAPESFGTDQGQPDPVVSLTINGPPAAGTETLFGLSEYAHEESACVRVAACPAMVRSAGLLRPSNSSQSGRRPYRFRFPPHRPG